MLVRAWTPRASTRGWGEGDMVKLLSEAVGQFLVKTYSSVTSNPWILTCEKCKRRPSEDMDVCIEAACHPVLVFFH